MSKKSIIALILAVCLCAVMSACGKQNAPETTTEAPASLQVATIGEAEALENKGSVQTSVTDAAYVYVFELNGVYWRLTAALTTEQAEELWGLDISDDDYAEKSAQLTSQLAVTNCENLNGQMLTEDEMTALKGKTGAELMANGWTSGFGYNLDEMEFYLDKGPFSYTVVFESPDVPLENTDDFDEDAAIRDLKVVSVSFDGLGNTATDIEVAAEPAT